MVLSEAMPEGNKQADAAVGGDELRRELGEDGVGVDVALAGKGIHLPAVVLPLSAEVEQGLGDGFGLFVAFVERGGRRIRAWRRACGAWRRCWRWAILGAGREKNSRSWSLMRSHGGVADDDVEAGLSRTSHRLEACATVLIHRLEACATGGKDFGEALLPVDGVGVDGGVGDERVAVDDVVAEGGEGLAGVGGLDPEGELGDLDGLGGEVDPVEVVVEDAPGGRVVRVLSLPIRRTL